MPRVPRGVALLLAVVVIAAATVYSVAWMYYAGREPVGAPRRESSIARRTGGCCWSVSSRALRPSVQACSPATASSRSTGGGSTHRTRFTMRSPADGRAIASPCESSGIRSLVHHAGDARGASPESAAAVTPRFVLSLLRFYPAAFLIVAAAVLLQRPPGSHRLAAGNALHRPDCRRAHRWGSDPPGDAPVRVRFQDAGRPAAGRRLFFFAVFPTRSPIDLRAPWLKHVLLWPAVALIAVLVVIVGRAESLVPIRA